jgi:hypothetical protein
MANGMDWATLWAIFPKHHQVTLALPLTFIVYYHFFIGHKIYPCAEEVTALFRPDLAM